MSATFNYSRSRTAICSVWFEKNLQISIAYPKFFAITNYLKRSRASLSF